MMMDANLNDMKRRNSGSNCGELAAGSLDGPGCDHLLGYTFDYEGPSIFSESDENPTWEFDEGFQKEDEHHGIVYWNFCPKCGAKLSPPNSIKHILC